jgi:hypothetical protein
MGEGWEGVNQISTLVVEKRRVLERYLAAEHPGKRNAGDKGRRTILHIVADLGMPVDDILDASFRCNK